VRTSVAILLCFAGIASAAVQTEKVRNEKVAAFDCTLRPGDTVNIKDPSVTVYFQGGSLEITPQAGNPRKVSVKQGDTVFRPAQAGVIKNTVPPKSTLREWISGPAGSETWGTTGLAPNYKLLFDEPIHAVYDIRIPAGTNEPQHTLQERVGGLPGARPVETPDARPRVETLHLADCEQSLASRATHIGQNLGTTDCG